jgi:hypothetical protein
VHVLREGLVVAGDDHDDLEPVGGDRALRLVRQRALLVDRVDHRPGQGEHRALGPHEPQVPEPHHGLALRRHLRAHEGDLGVGAEELVVALVGHAEHQRGRALVPPDDGDPAEQQPGGGSGEAGEHERRRERQARGADHRLDRDEHVREARLRVHLAVADRGHGLHAEEEGVGEGAGPGLGDVALAPQVEQGEQHVDRGVGQQHAAEEGRPPRREQGVVGVPEPPAVARPHPDDGGPRLPLVQVHEPRRVGEAVVVARWGVRGRAGEEGRRGHVVSLPRGWPRWGAPRGGAGGAIACQAVGGSAGDGRPAGGMRPTPNHRERGYGLDLPLRVALPHFAWIGQCAGRNGRGPGRRVFEQRPGGRPDHEARAVPAPAVQPCRLRPAPPSHTPRRRLPRKVRESRGTGRACEFGRRFLPHVRDPMLVRHPERPGGERDMAGTGQP